MIDPDMDRELDIANEFVLEAQKAESMAKGMDFSLSTYRGPSSKSFCGANAELTSSTLENVKDIFLQTNIKEETTSNVDQMLDELDRKDLLPYPAESNYHLVPDMNVICRKEKSPDNQSITNCIPSLLENSPNNENQMSDSSSCFAAVPSLTKQLDKIDLLDSLNTTTPWLLSHRDDFTEQTDFKVQFLNLKEIYLKKQQLPMNRFGHSEIDDSLVHMYLKANIEIKRVKVYLKQWIMKANTNYFGPIEIHSNYNTKTGFLFVDFNCVTWDLLHRGESTSLEEDQQCQLFIVAQFQNGKSGCQYSKPFQVRTVSQDKWDQRIDIESPDTTPQHHPSNPDDPACSADRPKSILLLQETSLDIKMISRKLHQDEEISSVQEQKDFSGLLKVTKRNLIKNTSGKRKANGFRSADEAFMWSCGHCFFSRGKKSTVKSHVCRRVCLKKKRFVHESPMKEEGKVKPPFRRCHTFNGTQSQSLLQGEELKQCKTP